VRARETLRTRTLYCLPSDMCDLPCMARACVSRWACHVESNFRRPGSLPLPARALAAPPAATYYAISVAELGCMRAHHLCARQDHVRRPADERPQGHDLGRTHAAREQAPRWVSSVRVSCAGVWAAMMAMSDVW
jgi:hypothetical protein